MSIRNRGIVRFQVEYAIAIAICTLLSACVPVLASSKYYKHDITIIVDGHARHFERYFECSQTLEWSENDNGLHPKWDKTGDDFTAVDIGKGRVLIYKISGDFDCESDYQQLHVPPELMEQYSQQTVRVLDSSKYPHELHVLTTDTDGFPVALVQQSVRRIDPVKGPIGPLRAERVLKESVLKRQHGYQRVTASIVPFEIWGAADAARQYFSQFTTVTLARASKFPQATLRDAYVAEFPFYHERVYEKGMYGETLALKKLGTVYDGNVFNLENGTNAEGFTWYSLQKARTHQIPDRPPIAAVEYKGVIFEIADTQEIYDPETKTILSFSNQYIPYPMGNYKN
jgi:hypothetical protein